MATVDKDFRVKNGLVVEGTTATVNGNSVITQGDDTDVLNEGATNLYYTDGRVKDVLTGSTQTNISITEVEGALVITAENGVADSTTDDLSEGSTNLYFTDQRALDATSAAYDAAGSAATAESNAAADATSKADAAQAAAESTASADATSKADAAQAAAEDYADALVGDATVDGTAGNTVTDRIGTAVSNLVDGAPALLDTLNELAAAIADDEAFSTTITTAIGEKVAKAGDTMTGDLTLAGAPSSDLHASTKKYVDDSINALDTDAIEEGSTNLYFTDVRAVDALEAVVPNFTAVEINTVSKQVAATINLADTAQTAVYTFAKASYRSAKFIVKSAYGTHTEMSEILVTLDTSDNVAITEYAIVSTNGSLATISAGINGANIEILATAGTADTDVTVFGTLIA
jgi:hypothetical protein